MHFNSTFTTSKVYDGPESNPDKQIALKGSATTSNPQLVISNSSQVLIIFNADFEELLPLYISNIAQVLDDSGISEENKNKIVHVWDMITSSVPLLTLMARNYGLLDGVWEFVYGTSIWSNLFSPDLFININELFIGIFGYYFPVSIYTE